MAKTVFFFGMSRGGSSITFQIIQKILLSLGYKHYDPEGDAYRNGGKSLGECPELLAPIKSEMNNVDMIVGPFRNNTEQRSQFALDELIANCSDPRIIIITRDPVDCLYSWYFARNLHPGWSNENIKGDPTPSEFAQQLAPSYFREVVGLINLSAHSNARHFAYHDIVFSPTNWLQSVIESLDITPQSKNLAQVNSRMAFLNPFENKLAHRRSGVPGSSRMLISEDSQAAIDTIFDSFNQHFKYPRQPATESEMKMAMEISSLRDSIDLLMTHNAELRKAIAKLSKKSG